MFRFSFQVQVEARNQHYEIGNINYSHIHKKNYIGGC
jgi:hypothetical protein